MTSTAGTVAGKALDIDAINKLLSETRTRGDYDVYLDEFYASGEAGIEVPVGEGQFAGKDALNVYTGLNNAKKKLYPEKSGAQAGTLVRPWGPKIRVIKKNFGGSGAEGAPAKDEHVFLINTELVEGAPSEEEAQAQSEQE
jgi:hypothetical protein